MHSCKADDCLFQSTRPRGARLEYQSHFRSLRSFNPRAREGRDYRFAVCLYWYLCFNPRAREGRDGGYTPCRIYLTGFNPRAREGRDLSK